MQEHISIENIQKEPVYWRNGERLNSKNLALAIELQVENETRPILTNNSKEPKSTIGLTFSKIKNATLFEAQPSFAFSSSAMLTRMLEQIKELSVDQNCAEPNSTAKSILKLDEMLNCVILHRLDEPESFICQLCVHPSDKSHESLLVLQNLLTFCFSQSAKADKLYLSLHEIEKNIASLRLYSFAWLCSVVQTLGLHPMCERLENLLKYNVKRYLKRKNAEDLFLSENVETKDFYYVLMFFCSICIRRAEPMQSLLNFLYKKKYIEMFRKCYHIFERQFLFYNTVATSNVALKIVESLQLFFKDNDAMGKKKIKISRSETNDALTLVQVFVSWLNKTVSKTTAKERQEFLQTVVLFDRCRCEIVCDSDVLHRKFIVKKFDRTTVETRSCRMSFTDLCEWLRYMVLLQLDKRNVHTETKFYIYALPCLYKFGAPPSLQFQSPGKDFLSFFLLESEFFRTSLYQKRPELREMREEMACDDRLKKFVCTKEPYNDFIILSEKLLKVAVEHYHLKTIQAVTQNSSNYSN